mmetsp:Transcript_9007/g.24236  ORF Transcript_9007/g.24236 Transcript_9007/m.24236 type:complete len:217 (+) Transcript_9007:1161-1811(+)
MPCTSPLLSSAALRNGAPGSACTQGAAIDSGIATLLLPAPVLLLPKLLQLLLLVCTLMPLLILSLLLALLALLQRDRGERAAGASLVGLQGPQWMRGRERLECRGLEMPPPAPAGNTCCWKSSEVSALGGAVSSVGARGSGWVALYNSRSCEVTARGSGCVALGGVATSVGARGSSCVRGGVVGLGGEVPGTIAGCGAFAALTASFPHTATPAPSW